MNQAQQSFFDLFTRQVIELRNMSEPKGLARLWDYQTGGEFCQLAISVFHGSVPIALESVMSNLEPFFTAGKGVTNISIQKIGSFLGPEMIKICDDFVFSQFPGMELEGTTQDSDHCACVWHKGNDQGVVITMSRSTLTT